MTPVTIASVCGIIACTTWIMLRATILRSPKAPWRISRRRINKTPEDYLRPW